LKPRVSLAKQLSDVTQAKEKKDSGDALFKEAAEDLGVDYDSEEFEKESSGKRGRGSARRQKERDAKDLSKEDVRAMRAELNSLLKQRVNIGVSERYPSAELLKQRGSGGDFLGVVNGLGFDD